VDFLAVQHFEQIEGQGIRGEIQLKGEWKKIVVGNFTCLQACGVDYKSLKNTIKVPPKTLVTLVAVDSEVIGYFMFSDTLRAESCNVIQQLKKLGVKRFAVVSGDSNNVVQNLANEVGIDEAYGDCLPKDKAAHVERLRKQGNVMFVGDGINDVLAIASANVGVALVGSSETSGPAATIASESSDVVIMKGNLLKIVSLITLGKSVLSTAKQSALGGIGVSIGVMMLALLEKLGPTQTAMAQEGVDLIAILNALRVVRTILPY